MKRNPTLPKFLHPKKISTLERIGQNNDGGYIIDKVNISKSDVLVGLGMKDDWSFEEHFNSINSIPVYIYDGTVSFKKFYRNFIKNIVRINKPKIFLHSLKTLYKYKKFFKGDRRHIEKLVGINFSPNYISLSAILQQLKSDNFSNIYLKIDIEGWEYRLLKDLITHSEVIEGLVIEFHDVDLHLPQIEQFINEFSLSLVHTHCNNYAPMSDDNVPLVIECSFSSKSTVDILADKFPNKLDMPNDPAKADYIIDFLT